MATRPRGSIIHPVPEDSPTISGMGSTTRAPLPLTPQNPSHERAISILNNAIQTINIIGSVVPLPVVKGVLLSIAGILGIVKNTFTNKSDFQELAEQCQMIGLLVWRATSRTPEHQLDTPNHRSLTDLKSSVDGILQAVKAKAEKNPASKAFHATVNQDTIIKWRNELNRLLIRFNTELNISTNLKLDELLSSFQAFRSIVTSNLQTDIQVSVVLPARPRIFVGRDDLVLNTVEALLKNRHVALIGPGGIGKSSIARAVLNDEAIVSKFQDRRYFVRFDDIDATQVNLGTFLDHVARGLGLSTSVNAHDLITRVLLTSVRTLLVLDNAETFLDAAVDAGRIADTMDGFGARPNVAILLTTRTTVLPPNMEWVRLRVPVLAESAACEAFKAFYPSIETSILIKVLSAVDFHPLSINLLAQAAVQNEWSPQDLTTAWDRQRTVLLEAGEGKIQSIAITMETSLNSPSFVKLGETVHHLLQIITFLPQGISKTRVTAIFPAVSNIEACVDALCRQSLAYLDGDFITLLAPIRLYMSNRYNRDTSMNPLLRRVRTYYAAHIRERKIVVSENVNIEHVLIHWLRDTEGHIETILDVLRTTDHFLLTLRTYRPRPVSMRPVISALDVSKSYNSTSRMNFRMIIPMLRKPKILYQKKSTCLAYISYLMRLTGQTEEAEKAYVEAQTLSLKVGDLDQLVFIDWALASSYSRRGDFQTAENLLQKALNYYSGFSSVFRLDRRTKAMVKLDMMTINIIKGRPDAIQSYLESLSTFKQKRRGQLFDLSYINFFAGFLELRNGHLDVAKKFFEGIQTNDDEDNPQRRLRLIGLAELADQQGDQAESKALRAQLLEWINRIPDQSKDYVNAAKALLAAYLAMEGNVERARELIVPVVRHTTKYLYLQAVYYKYLAGMVELADGNFDKAGDYFHETIKGSISFAELVFHARSHRALGEIAVVKGDLMAARKHFETTTELCKTMGLPKERLYFSETCFIPSKTFDGWRLYQEGHAMFDGVVDRQA